MSVKHFGNTDFDDVASKYIWLYTTKFFFVQVGDDNDLRYLS